MLVLMPGNETRREVLFVREADARREHWNGHSLTPAEAAAQSGIQTVMTARASSSRSSPRCSRSAPRRVRAPARPSTSGSSRRSAAARRSSRCCSNRRRLCPSPGPETRVRRRSCAIASSAFPSRTPRRSSIDLRQVKTAYEQDVLRRSVAISSEAHRAGMKAAAPGKFEYEVEAAIEDVYLRNGAMSWGYPSIVGSGPNATILHYGKSSRQMEPAICCSSTPPATTRARRATSRARIRSADASRRAQRDIYEIVLAAQEAGIKAARAGSTPADIQAACDEVLRAGLVKLGLVTDADRPAVQDLGDARRRPLDRHGRARRRRRAVRSSRAWRS